MRLSRVARRCFILLLAYVASEGGLAAGIRPADVAICAHLDGARADVAPASKVKLELLRALAVSMDFTVPPVTRVARPAVRTAALPVPGRPAPPGVFRLIPRPPSA